MSNKSPELSSSRDCHFECTALYLGILGMFWSHPRRSKPNSKSHCSVHPQIPDVSPEEFRGGAQLVLHSPSLVCFCPVFYVMCFSFGFLPLLFLFFVFHFDLKRF